MCTCCILAEGARDVGREADMMKITVEPEIAIQSTISVRLLDVAHDPAGVGGVGLAQGRLEGADCVGEIHRVRLQQQACRG